MAKGVKIQKISAVIFNKLRGLQNKIHGEGMHFKIPIILRAARN